MHSCAIRLAVTAWFPSWPAEGVVGQVFRVIARYLPPPPGAASRWAWAAEDSVAALLGPLGYAVQLARRMAPLSYRSPDVYVGYLEEVHGPTIMALRLVRPGHDCRR
jgi:hypothetical protein